MKLDSNRVFKIQAISLLGAMISFSVILTLLLKTPSFLELLFVIPGVIITTYFCIMLFTINNVIYSSDSFFALYVMTEYDRQWRFRYARDHPKENSGLGIYGLIGYKISEAQ